jgi:peptidoglycan/xylan/chitin deacetylase (PgdA/CDA1 family)
MNTLSAPQSFLLRLAGSIASGRGPQASLLVLIFHRVMAQRDALIPSEPDAETFSSIVKLLGQHFNTLRLSDAVHKLATGTLPPRAVCITFDDGYANNCEVALPILAAHKTPATVFVAPGFLNGGRMFNDTIIEALRRAPAEFDLSTEGLGVFKLGDLASRMRAAGEIILKLKHLNVDQRWDVAERIGSRCGAPLPDDLMMTDEQVRRLHKAGIEIGAHTMTHPILTRIDAQQAQKEIADSKAYLETLIGTPVTTFAYPNGRPMQDYDATHVEIVRASRFEFALSTAWGAATADSDRFQIPRIAPWDASAFRYTARIVRGFRQRNFVTV